MPENDEELEKKVYIGEGVEIADGTEQVPCDIHTEKKIPDELREPIPETHAEEVLLLPGPIPVWNHEKRAECITNEGQYGDLVIVEERRFTQEVYFSTVLSISDEVLDYIAGKKLEERIGFLFHNEELDRDLLSSMTGMTKVEAEALLSELDYVQHNLDRAAEESAKAALSCYYLNKEQIVECEDPEMLKDGEYEGVVFSAKVEAGQFSSPYSQEDADRAAEQAAEDMLICMYGNDPFTARCEERPDRLTDIVDPVPNDTEELYPGRGLRVGEVVVEKNKFTSTESKDDANAQAMNWGFAQLICWYPNLPVEMQCEDPDARNYMIDPAVTPPADADPETGRKGQHVLIPEGFYTSELSTDDATERAQLEAELLLECCYINDELTIECLPEKIVASDGKEYEVEANCELGTCISVAPRGMFGSCLSKEEANSFAQNYLEGSLECIYCNELVMPTCVPDWVKQGVLDGSITLPLAGPVITDGVNSIPAHKLPPEATRGAPQGAVCLGSATHAQLMAEASGSVTVSGTADTWCSCYSEEVVIGCAVEDPYGNNLPYTGGRGFKENGEPYNFFSLFPAGTQLSENFSSPAPGEYIVFGAGIFAYNCYGIMDEERDGTDAGTQAVMELAKAMLHCAIENPIATGTCEQDLTPSWADLYGWNFGKKHCGTNRLTPWSHRTGNLVKIPKGMMHKEVHSLAEIDDARQEIFEGIKDMIYSLMMCSCYNERKESRGICGPPTVHTYGGGSEPPYITSTCTTAYRSANEVIVPAQTVIAPTAEEADAIAEDMARSVAVCDQDTTCEFELEVGNIFSPPVVPSPSTEPSQPEGPLGPDNLPCEKDKVDFEVGWRICGEGGKPKEKDVVVPDPCKDCLKVSEYKHNCVGFAPADPEAGKEEYRATFYQPYVKEIIYKGKHYKEDDPCVKQAKLEFHLLNGCGCECGETPGVKWGSEIEAHIIIGPPEEGQSQMESGCQFAECLSDVTKKVKAPGCGGWPMPGTSVIIGVDRYEIEPPYFFQANGENYETGYVVYISDFVVETECGEQFNLFDTFNRVTDLKGLWEISYELDGAQKVGELLQSTENMLDPPEGVESKHVWYLREGGAGGQVVAFGGPGNIKIHIKGSGEGIGKIYDVTSPLADGGKVTADLGDMLCMVGDIVLDIPPVSIASSSPSSPSPSDSNSDSGTPKPSPSATSPIPSPSSSPDDGGSSPSSPDGGGSSPSSSSTPGSSSSAPVSSPAASSSDPGDWEFNISIWPYCYHWKQVSAAMDDSQYANPDIPDKLIPKRYIYGIESIYSKSSGIKKDEEAVKKEWVIEKVEVAKKDGEKETTIANDDGGKDQEGGQNSDCHVYPPKTLKCIGFDPETDGDDPSQTLATCEFTTEKECEKLYKECWLANEECEVTVTIKNTSSNSKDFNKKISCNFIMPACSPKASGCDYHECPQLEWESCEGGNAKTQATQIKFDHIAQQLRESKQAYMERWHELQTRIKRLKAGIAELETYLLTTKQQTQ